MVGAVDLLRSVRSIKVIYESLPSIGRDGSPNRLSSMYQRDEDVRPIMFATNQFSTHRILTDVRKFLSQTFVVAKAVIEEIALPFYPGELGGDSFIIANKL